MCVHAKTLLSLSIANILLIFCLFSNMVFSNNTGSSSDRIRFRVNSHLRLSTAIKKKENQWVTLESLVMEQPDSHSPGSKTLPLSDAMRAQPHNPVFCKLSFRTGDSSIARELVSLLS